MSGGLPWGSADAGKLHDGVGREPRDSRLASGGSYWRSNGTWHGSRQII